ncbi:Probable aspartyl aminopeptidase [Durusdinium trenchii]|uniref:aspartyl aminopeptidase n=1 Tax=Durusdinium trenchii TaxID=1381693 RepID=A0ABP0QS57_9DINO
MATVTRVDSARSALSKTRSGPGGKSSGGNGGGPAVRRQCNFSEVVEAVFEVLVGDYATKHQLEVPGRFCEFYSSALMQQFLAHVVFYFYAHVNVLRQFHEQIVADVSAGANKDDDHEPRFDASAKFFEAREEQKRRLEGLAQAYSRLLLTCSNFEQMLDDLHFFESVYHFTCLMVKSSVNSSPFNSDAFHALVRRELCFVFRGPCFDIEGKRWVAEEAKKSLVRKDQRKAVPPPSKAASARIGSAAFRAQRGATARVAAAVAAGGESAEQNQDEDSREVDLPDNSRIGIASLRCDLLGELPRGAEKEKKRKDLSGAGSLALLGRGPTTGVPKFSVHKAVNARSPMLSVLLPPPKEQARMNAAKVRLKVRRPPKAARQGQVGKQALVRETDRLLALFFEVARDAVLGGDRDANAAGHCRGLSPRAFAIGDHREAVVVGLFLLFPAFPLLVCLELRKLGHVVLRLLLELSKRRALRQEGLHKVEAAASFALVARHVEAARGTRADGRFERCGGRKLDARKPVAVGDVAKVDLGDLAKGAHERLDGVLVPGRRHIGHKQGVLVARVPVLLDKDVLDELEAAAVGRLDAVLQATNPANDAAASAIGAGPPPFLLLLLALVPGTVTAARAVAALLDSVAQRVGQRAAHGHGGQHGWRSAPRNPGGTEPEPRSKDPPTHRETNEGLTVNRTTRKAKAREMSQAFARKFTAFVDGSPTPFHCVAQTVKRLEAGGFKRILETDAWKLTQGGKYYYTRNGSTIVAFAVGGKFEAGNGFKVVGAHTDSPALKVKPVSKRTKNGYLQVGVECYGGGLWHTWFDRDLGVAGRVIVRTESEQFEQRLVHIKEPILRIPNLAIHLQTGEERAAFKVNKENHLTPVLGLVSEQLNKEEGSTSGGDGRHLPQFLSTLAKELSVTPEAIVDMELTLTDTQPASIGGLDGAFIFSPRLDNQMHCFTGVEALMTHCEGAGNLESDTGISVVVLFDHEECGSQSQVGAGSPIMRDAVERISGCFMEGRGDKDQLYKIGLSRSFLVSADGAHAIHPNYASKHEQNHGPKMGAGTVIKTNDNQRYATNAVTGFVIRQLARLSGLQIQEFVVRNDCPCGTTIGPIISANTGIATVDLGVAQLSMHSIREQCAVDDLWTNQQLLAAFFKHAAAVLASLSDL